MLKSAARISPGERLMVRPQCTGQEMRVQTSGVPTTPEGNPTWQTTACGTLYGRCALKDPVLAGANNPVREPNWGRLVGPLNRLANIRGTPEIGM